MTTRSCIVPQNPATMKGMNTDLLSYVTGRLAEYRGPLADLARDAGVPYSWLLMLHRGEIPNPGVRSIQRLADYFTLVELTKPRKRA
jgi:hypothetical protein